MESHGPNSYRFFVARRWPREDAYRLHDTLDVQTNRAITRHAVRRAIGNLPAATACAHLPILFAASSPSIYSVTCSLLISMHSLTVEGKKRDASGGHQSKRLRVVMTLDDFFLHPDPTKDEPHNMLRKLFARHLVICNRCWG